MRRGQIWWTALPDPAGSGPGFRRPVAVVQSNPFNASRIRTIVVVAITSNLRLAEAPGNFKLSKKESGLSKPSVANISQVFTIDRDYLTEQVGTLGARPMHAIDEGLRLVLAL